MRAITAFMLVTLFVPDRPAPSGSVKDELAKLDGTWMVVSYEWDGGRLSDAELAMYPRLIMKGETYRWSNSPTTGVMTVNPTLEPKGVDYLQPDGTKEGKLHLGIYDLQGDIFRDCIAPPGKERPRDFTIPPGSGRTHFVYRRVKD